MVNKEQAQVRSSVQKVEMDSLPEAEVLVQVAYSSLNYKGHFFAIHYIFFVSQDKSHLNIVLKFLATS